MDTRTGVCWDIGQPVTMQMPDSVVPPGTNGIIEAIYPELESLAVRFLGRTAADIVGPEEVAPLQPVTRWDG